MDKEPNNKNRLSLQSIRESLRTLSLSTLLLIVTTAVALVAVGSLAWMSENRKLDADGIHANMQGERYHVSFLETDDANSGLYETYRQKIVGYDDSALVWQMTATNNLENYNNTDKGLEPDSYGVISFKVNPNVASVNLDLTFELCAYSAYTIGQDTELRPSDDGVARFLNGHIMLFMNKDEESGKYSNPILPDANGQRTYHLGTITQRQDVNVYWVWPYSLSTIIDAGESATIEPFFDHATELIVRENILDFPQYYMKGVSNVSLQNIQDNYLFYGDSYDRADNDIGNSVDYVLVRMKVSESEELAAVPESGETGGNG